MFFRGFRGILGGFGGFFSIFGGVLERGFFRGALGGGRYLGLAKGINCPLKFAFIGLFGV